MTTTRREVMFGAAAFGLAGAVSGRAAAAPAQGARGPAARGAPDPDVIVLGAGIAGLNAAALLEAEGSRVLVLEGRRRVGGRILTLFDQPGTPELGFNSMGAGYGRGIDAAHRAGVELYDVGPRYTRDPRQQLIVGGAAFTRDEWRASAANPLPPAWRDLMPWEVVPAAFARHNPLRDWTDWQAPASAPLDRSVHDFLVDQGLSEPAIRLVFDAAPYYGSTSFDAGVLTYAFNSGWVAAQAAAGPGSFAVRGGNQKLPEAMAARLKGDVLLGREVVAIRTETTGVEVRTRDGGRFRAKRVVCTLPFATLRNVAIEPGLTGAQAQAVATLPYAPISIAFLRVRAPYWRSDGLPVSMWTDGPLGAVLAQRYGTDPDEVTGLLVFARGKLALYWDRLGREAALALIVAELARLRPASQGHVVAAALHSWALEPFNGGDWAYFAPGQITAFAGAMAKPAGRLHFCGEHTAVGNRGLEGALESSERAVLEILTA